MRRTRSLRKMKLPLRRPSTSSSPSGYAAVIAWPSSRTRRAIVSSSKTIRLSSRPPVCLRLAVLGNIDPHRRGSGPREIVHTPADSRDPQNGFAADDHRVAGPVAARHARFHEHPPQRPPPDAADRHQPVAWTRRPHLPPGPAHPSGPPTARQARGGAAWLPAHVKCSEDRRAPRVAGHDVPDLSPLPPNLPLRRRGVVYTEAIERHLRHPAL